MHEEQTPTESEGGVETLSDPEVLEDYSRRRQRAWKKLKRKLKPKHALRYWVLFVPFESGLEWEEIVQLVRQKGWCDGHDDCCPPGVVAKEVEAAFEAWAKRSGALSAANVRRAYSRYRKALRA